MGSSDGRLRGESHGHAQLLPSGNASASSRHAISLLENVQRENADTDAGLGAVQAAELVAGGRCRYTRVIKQWLRRLGLSRSSTDPFT